MSLAIASTRSSLPTGVSRRSLITVPRAAFFGAFLREPADCLILLPEAVLEILFTVAPGMSLRISCLSYSGSPYVA